MLADKHRRIQELERQLESVNEELKIVQKVGTCITLITMKKTFHHHVFLY